jgi:hypothetical protein
MADDWRLKAEMESDGLVGRLVELLRARSLAEDLRERLGSRLVVSHNGPELFVYGERREDIEQAQRVVEDLAREHDLDVRTTVQRWHPVEEEWEDASVPLPDDPEDIQRELARRDAEDEAESEEQGYPEWEVRLTLPSPREARELAERLEAEGIPVVRRWRHVLVGAETESDAQVLAERLRGEAPPGTEFHIELNGLEIWRQIHPAPLTVLGGLAQ